MNHLQGGFADAAMPSRGSGILLAPCFLALGLRSVFKRPPTFARCLAVLGSLRTVAAFARAILARLAVASESNMAEDLSARITDLGDKDAVLVQQRTALLFSELAHVPSLQSWSGRDFYLELNC